MKHVPAITFLAVSIFLAYSNTLNGTWALDDTTIGTAAGIEGALNLKLGYRKVTYLSFLFNKWINPFSVFNYRVTNIALHIINSALVYWISLATLRLPEIRERFGRLSFPVALLTATVFALHPININAVAYIVQRMTALSALFVFLSLLSYLYARTSSGKAAPALLYGISAGLIFMGIFSKENAVMALPLIVVYDLFFISRFRWKGLLPKIVIGLSGGLAVIAISSVYLDFSKAAGELWRVYLNMNRQIPPLGWTAADVYWTPLQHVLTEFRVLGRYMLLLAAPLPDLLVFDRWGMTLSSGITEPLSTLFSFAVITALAVFSVIKARKLPFVSFGLLWYFTAISLESFIGVGSDLYFEHRNYLPAAGLFLGLSAQAVGSVGPVIVREKTLLAAVFLTAVLLGGLTFTRNFVWKDSVTLWTDTIKKEPGNVRAMVAAGNSYMKLADLKSAAVYYEKALSLSSSSGRAGYFHDAAYSLGMASLFAGDLRQAKKVIDIMDSRLSETYTTSILKGYYSSLVGDTDGAVRLLNSALPQAGGIDVITVHTLLGDTYRRAGDPDRALGNYKKAVELDPSFSAAYYGMGDCYFLKKDLVNAEKYIGKTLSLDPSNPLALALMSDIMLVKKEPLQKAKAYADRAVSVSSAFYQPYAAMGTVLIVMGREDEAEQYFGRAAQHGLRGYRLPMAKARAYFIKGDEQKAGIFLREIAAMEDAPASLRDAIKKDRGGHLSR
ncbi:MAG: tetratricopeptide repeat protein [Nitrospirae bacterium]|nr:tetratricopeptide repeat protein [Nitrospirota bacterium]